MIKTGKQATRALMKIKRKTDWSLRRIAQELGWSHGAVTDLYRGYTKNPGEDFMQAIERLEKEVEKF